MALTRRQKIIRFGFAGFLLFFFFILPVLLGIFMRGSIEAKIQKEANAPVKLGSLAIHLFPPGATLSSLEIGAADSAAANQPIIKIDSMRANVSLGTVFGGNTHVTSISISGAEVNAVVNDKFDSTLAKFLRELPPPEGQKPELPIDSLTIRRAKLNSFMQGKKSGSSSEPDGTLEIAYFNLSDFIVPPSGQLLGREIWSSVAVEGVRCSAPVEKSDAPSGAVPDGLSVRSCSLQMAQAASTETPIKIKGLSVSGAEIATVYTKPGTLPMLKRALTAVQLAIGDGDEKGRKRAQQPQGCGTFIEDLNVTGRIETRGPDADAKLAFWRLNDLKIAAKKIAIGPKFKNAESGELKIESPSESSSGAGSLALIVSNITGSYPNMSFECDYKLNSVGAPPFSVAAQESAGVGIKAGQISMAFTGPAKNGKLDINGSLTLSKDFEITGTFASQIAKIERGVPLKPVSIRGRLDDPKLSWPSAIAGVLGNAFEKILTGGPVGILDTAGGFMGGATEQTIREATKGMNGAGDLMKKLPGVKDLFGK